MVVTDLKGKTVFLDTAPLIYFIEGHSEHQGTLQAVFSLIDKQEILAISSTITLLEVLVKPLREKRNDLVEKYNEILTSSKGLDLLNLDVAIAMLAVKLRSKYNLRTPDSIQLATAIHFNADYFITNDARIKSVTEIKSFTLQDLE